MNENTIITLLTDFGRQDNYTAILKGVIFSINRHAKIIDISHELPPFNIRAGHYLLETSYKSFPAGTIHLAIVDPGVGTSRKSILIDAGDYCFIGPDNGLFSFLGRSKIKNIINLTKRKYFLSEISTTFHGRDIFAPVAAYLSTGVTPEQFGPSLSSITRPKKKKTGSMGEIIYIDYFGNLVTSFKEADLPEKYVVYLEGIKIGRPRRTFGSVKPGQPVCYINSFGYLEIAVNLASAAEIFDIDYSTPTKILIASP